MHLLKKFVLTLLLLLTIISLSRAAPPSYLLTKKDYLYDTFFKVEATDLMDLDYSQVVVLGRDYTERRISVQLLSWSEGDLVSHWESPNLINEGYLPGNSLLSFSPKIISIFIHTKMRE
jgi:hypothetical protein